MTSSLSFGPAPIGDGISVDTYDGARPGERQPTEDLSLALGRVATELANLHKRIVGLQHLLGPTLASAAEVDPLVVSASQDFDLVAQSLDGLATFVVALGRGTPGVDRLDPVGAAALVKLDALSSRLAGRVASDAMGCGDIDLF